MEFSRVVKALPGGLSAASRAVAVMALAQALAVGARAGESGVLATLTEPALQGDVRFLSGSIGFQPSSGGPIRNIALDQLRFLRLQRLDYPSVVPVDDERAGVRVTTYHDPGFAGPGVSRSEAAMQFPVGEVTWKRGGEGPVAVRWEGLLVPLVTGVHQFKLRSTGIARLWINAHCVGSILATNQLRESGGELGLVADRRYPFLIEFAQAHGDAGVNVAWSAAGIPLSPMPASRLVNSPRTNALAGISKGLLATYFGNPDYSNPRTYRVDPHINTYWGIKPPFPELGVGNRFSVIWNGTLEVPKTDGYRFEFSMEGGLRCQLNGEVIQIRRDDVIEQKASMATFPIQIETGRRHPFRLEFFNEVGRASVTARFWLEEPGKTAVFADGLRPADPPDFSFPVPTPAASSESLTAAVPASTSAGVLLNDGSFVAQGIETASDSHLQLRSGDFPPKLPVDLISRIYLSEVTPSVASSFDQTRVGAYLHSGDFVEGDFQGMDSNVVRVGSILFGNQRLDRDRVLAVILRPSAPREPPWRVRTRSGSVFHGAKLEVIEAALRVGFDGGRTVDVPEARLLDVARGE